MRELVFVLKDDNTFESYPRPNITAKEKESDVIVLVANKVISTVVVANFLLENGLSTNLTQYLVPSEDLGKDVLDTTWSEFDTYAESKVWKASIHQNNLSAISKFHRGRVGIAFNFYTKILSNAAENYLGTFGTTDVPETATAGDYYVCNVGSYVSVNADNTFKYGQAAVWVDGAWTKVGSYVPIENTTTIYQKVDPSVVGIPPTETDEDLLDVYDGLGNLQDQIDTSKDKIENDTIQSVEDTTSIDLTITADSPNGKKLKAEVKVDAPKNDLLKNDGDGLYVKNSDVAETINDEIANVGPDTAIQTSIKNLIHAEAFANVEDTNSIELDVETETLSASLKVDPAIDNTIEVSSAGVKVAGLKTSAGVQYTLDELLEALDIEYDL